MMDAIQTERLLLRPLRPDDAEALFALFANWEVIRWLSMPPWPYSVADAHSFIAGQLRLDLAMKTFAITCDGSLIGGIDIRINGRINDGGASQSGPGPHLGYWLGQPYWGRGYMTEAARAFIGQVFNTGLGDVIYSGAFAGNAPSLRIQEKLGFVRDGETMLYARPRDRTFPHINTKLTQHAFKVPFKVQGP